ncbi:MAG: beta-aspartyl-peptidase [Thermovirgaceae bacterium]
MQVLLIRGGHVYAPDDLGILDILAVEGTIAAMAPEIDRKAAQSIFGEVEQLDASGTLVIPGFVDQHVHMNGGGGEGGPANRTPETEIDEYATGGVTSAIGLLGTDSVGRSLESLLMKARSLESGGISTWILSGSYEWPSVTITESVKRDLAVVDKVIGVKIALSDHRSSHPDVQSLRALLSEVRLGGITSGKAGIVAVHVGDEKSGLTPLLKAVDETGIPITQFAPTHLGRNGHLLSEAVEFARKGGYVDFTCRDGDTAEIIGHVLKQGVAVNRVTVSSDGHGSRPVFDEHGELQGISMHDLSGIHRLFRDLLGLSVTSLPDAVRICSTNTSTHYRLHGKGTLQKGCCADMVILEKEGYEIRDVISRGEILVRYSKVLRHPRFQREKSR